MKITEDLNPLIFPRAEGSDQTDPDNNETSAFTPDQIQEVLSALDIKGEGVGDLSDVELRLEEANCYKALLQNPLFDQSAGPIARRVESKVRDYIRLELKTLLGLVPRVIEAKPKESFTSDEVKALKMLSSRILGKSNEPKRELVVNQAQLNPPGSPIPVKAQIPKEQPKRGPGRPPKKASVRLPNGQVKEVEIPENTQVQPNGANKFPTLTAGQSAARQSQVALVNQPKGLTADLVNLVNK